MESSQKDNCFRTVSSFFCHLDLTEYHHEVSAKAQAFVIENGKPRFPKY
jgi:hypothetical protein